MSDVETAPEVAELHSTQEQAPETTTAAAESPAQEIQEEQPQEPQLSEVKAAALKKQVIQMGGGAVACVICEKRSYPAETTYFDQLPYHAECFKCTKCTQKIQGTVDATQYEHNLYCRRCFTASGFNRLQAQVKWTPKTTSGSGTAASGMFAKLGGGSHPCTACTKPCYPAETVSFEGKRYHNECIACSECSAKCTVNSINQFEEKLFCNKCWTQGHYAAKQVAARGASGPKSGGYNAVTLKLGGGSVPCPACDKACYPAEAVSYEGKRYHSECIACSECSAKCTVNTINQFEEKLFCNKCWTQGGYTAKQVAARAASGPKSGGYSAVTLKLGGGSVPCPACDKACYPAEAVSYEGKRYHNDCIACSECSAKCTVNSINQFEEKLFCNKCWTQGGYTAKQVAARASANAGKTNTYNAVALKLGGGATPCTACSKSCYPAETVSFEGKPYHSECIACSECSTKTTVNNINKFDDKLFCGKCWTQGGFASKQREVKWEKKEGAAPVNSIAAKLGGGGAKCFVCEKTAYPAETIQYEGKPYHSKCFNCKHCGIRIPGVGQAQHKRQEVYCAKCFQELGLWRPDA